MEHQTLKDNLNALCEIRKELKERQLEMRPLSKAIKELRAEEAQYKSAIQEELRLNNQSGVEYKNLKIDIRQRSLKTHCKKGDREALLSEALSELGISDTGDKAKHILEYISKGSTEQKDVLRVQTMK